MTTAASPRITDELINKLQKGSETMTESKAIALAGELYTRKRYRQAVNVCRQLLKHRATLPDAHNILGVSLAAAGAQKAGVAAIKRAISLAPKIANYHANLGEVLRVGGDLPNALIALMEAVKLDPKNAQAHNNLGIVRYERKEYVQAIECYRTATALNPNFAEAYNNLGNSLRIEKDIDGANAAYVKALSLRESYPEAYNNLGTLLREQGKVEQAEHALKKAVQLNSRYFEARLNLAAIYHADNRDVEALREMSEVLGAEPRNEKALLLTARIQLRRGNLDAAEKACQIVLQDNPGSSEAYAALASVMHEVDRFDEAIQFLEKALELNPDNAEARNFYGVTLKSVGRLDEAREQILRAVQENDRMYGAYANLNDLIDFSKEPELAAKLRGFMDEAPDKNARSIIPLHYACAKVAEDLGEHAKALEHYIVGGKVKRETLNYNEDETRQFFESIQSTFTKSFFKDCKFRGNDSDRPVFIVGMPRSGSTLVEQILSSHPQVHGAGEVKFLSRNLHALRDRFPSLSRYPAMVGEMDQEQFEGMAANYLANLGAGAGEATRITDKLLTNYYFVGLIHLLFPNARIINTRRDPVDTCLSAFTKLFKDDMPHSYDLGELGRYHVMYERLMDHWNAVLPKGVMTTVVYEDVVKDTEKAAKDIIKFIGLPWDDKCLEFYKSDRPVKTASVAQVRKPIYTTAVERWRKYGDGLQPLLEALGRA